MGAIWAMALKDLRLLFRDKGAAFFTIVFPLAISLFFGFIFGGLGGSESGTMKVIAVNEDGGPASQGFLKDLAADDALTVYTTVGKDAEKHAASREEGASMVRKGSVAACVIVPKGFEDSDMFSGGGMKIEALIDPSHSAEGGLLTGKLNQIAFQQMSKTFTDPARMNKSLEKARASVQGSTGLSESQKGVLNSLFGSLDKFSKSDIKMGEDEEPAADGKKSEGGGWSPVHVEVKELKGEDRPGPKNSFEISFPQGVVWGLMGVVTAFGASMASERSKGTLMRLYAAPVTKQHVLLGKALACFLACVLVQVMLLAFGSIPGLNIHIGSPLLMVVAVLMSAFGFTGVMMIMSGLMRTEGAASGMGRGLIIMLAMIGGGTMPLVYMPAFMDKISVISPFKWAITSFEGALWRGFTPADMALPVAVLAFMGLAGFGVGAMALRKAEAV